MGVVRLLCSESTGAISADTGRITASRQLVIVGDGACGKTCLLTVFSKGTFPEAYGQIFDEFKGHIESDGHEIRLTMRDTPGQEDYDRLRALSYPETDVVLICFAIDSPDSLDNVLEKWIAEVFRFCRGMPIILVGCKKDLRYDQNTIEELSKTSQKPVTPEEGEDVRKKIGAQEYLECSAKRDEGVREVFLQASLAAMYARTKKEKGCCLM